MSLVQPRTLPGARELLPHEQIAFQGLLDTIRTTYERFGYLPIETPVMELAEVLLTKEGGETERQVYFAQSTGDREAGREPELALRFDLTVPLARYVAQYEGQLSFPFRRYQIQRVYRGERAQRGRFREFYQCDIDIVGQGGLPVRYDAELPAVIHQLFSQLEVGGFMIQINNRKLLRGFLAALGIADGEQQKLLLREVDKLDKRGADWLRQTLSERFGLDAGRAARLVEFVAIRSQSQAEAGAILDRLEREHDEPLLRQGTAELREVLARVADFGVPDSHLQLNFAIARGLDYYTGTVYETVLTGHPEIGSVCSGGAMTTWPRTTPLAPARCRVADRRHAPVWQLRELGMYRQAGSTVQVLATLMDEALLPHSLALATRLRTAGLAVQTQLEAGKLGRQLRYADRAGIRFALILGSDELSRGVVTVRDLPAQEQFEASPEALPALLQQRLAQVPAEPAR